MKSNIKIEMKKGKHLSDEALKIRTYQYPRQSMNVIVFLDHQVHNGPKDVPRKILHKVLTYYFYFFLVTFKEYQKNAIQS